MPHASPFSELSERLNASPEIASLLISSIDLVSGPDTDVVVAGNHIAELAKTTFGLNNVVVASGERGRWKVISSSGKTRLPIEFLSEVLDDGKPHQQSGLLGAPLIHRGDSGEIVFVEDKSNQFNLEKTDSLAALFGIAFHLGRELRAKDRRIRQQQAILEISTQWNQAQEVAPLLEQMAEAATKLMNSERASIFLWDRNNKKLIGRPALGVENNELKIPDTTGIVGQVVQSGEVRRVDLDVKEEQAEIDRKVDKKLGFETKTLLCAPLLSHGKILGAFEMINKIGGNFDSEDEADLVELAEHAAIALENTQHVEELEKKQETLVNQAASEVQMIGDCNAVQEMKQTIERVAQTDLSVLILGENGTGKEVAGGMVHYLSKRRKEPIVAVNCAAITESLLESELFGHEKGAFTDANETRAGKFEVASGGTLFLDEIGDMSLAGQAKLLRVLEEKVVVRVGGSTPITADVRIVAATNQNLAELVRQKKFREDLFFRLTVVTVNMPPLRERGDDVFLLAEFFLKTFCQQAKRKVPSFTAVAKKKLLQHAWPGNVRELRNMMERLAYLTQEDKIDGDDLAFIMTGPMQDKNHISLDLNLGDATKEFQIEFIEKQINAARGNMTDAAKRLGLHRSNLYRKMRQLEMDVTEDD